MGKLKNYLLAIAVTALLMVSPQVVHALAFGVKTIQLQDNFSTRFFTILELEAVEAGTGTNVALNASTVASSFGFNGPPDGAVDGDISAGCCFQLWHGDNIGAQLTITLPNPTDIEKLNFFSRIGCCPDARTNNFQVRLFDDQGTLIFQQDIVGIEGQSNQGSPFMIMVTGGSPPVPEPVVFDDFAIRKAEIKFKMTSTIDDRFKVRGELTLAATSNGIDVLNEEVMVTVGTSAITIPAGSFTEKGSGKFKFKGPIDGADVKMEIKQIYTDTFRFKVETKGVDLTGTANPTTIELTIGDDFGTAMVSLEGKLKFQAQREDDDDDDDDDGRRKARDDDEDDEDDDDDD